MALTKDERQDIAVRLTEIAELAREAAQAVRQDDAPLQPVGAICVEIQDAATTVVRQLLADIID